jgi:very-short-patch-repair endonuclease
MIGYVFHRQKLIDSFSVDFKEMLDKSPSKKLDILL